MAPRHIEVQLLGDHHGTVVPFVERECSIQRRHQKVVEESPSLAVSPELRRSMTSAAAAVAQAVGYTNAGTIEFLLDEDGSFYFLEMNTRLQVEHPITEMVTGVDLVQWQIRIARGERLDARSGGAADAAGPRDRVPHLCGGSRHRLPAVARAASTACGVPQGPGVRDDSGAYEGGEVPIFYDPMISKLITWGETRPRRSRACARARRVRGARHPDDDSVLPVDARATRTSRPGASTPRSWTQAGRAQRAAVHDPQPTRTTRCVARHRRGAADSPRSAAAAGDAARRSRWQQSARAGALR